MVFSHGFMHPIIGLHRNSRLTIEVEENNAMPFLDVLVTKLLNGQLTHKVYRKPTHTNGQLHLLKVPGWRQLRKIVPCFVLLSVVPVN